MSVLTWLLLAAPRHADASPPERPQILVEVTFKPGLDLQMAIGHRDSLNLKRYIKICNKVQKADVELAAHMAAALQDELIILQFTSDPSLQHEGTLKIEIELYRWNRPMFLYVSFNNGTRWKHEFTITSDDDLCPPNSILTKLIRERATVIRDKVLQDISVGISETLQATLEADGRVRIDSWVRLAEYDNVRKIRNRFRALRPLFRLSDTPQGDIYFTDCGANSKNPEFAGGPAVEWTRSDAARDCDASAAHTPVRLAPFSSKGSYPLYLIRY